MHLALQGNTQVLSRRMHGRASHPEPSAAVLSRSQEVTLVAAAQSGQDEAAGEIFDRHGTALLQLALAILRDGDQAEAVVADVIVQVCTESVDLLGDKSLRLELARRTYLHCVQRLPAVADISGMPAGPAGAVVAMTKLKELSRQQRATIALVMAGDHSYVDVAQLLRLSPARVLALLCSCLRELATTEKTGCDQRPLIKRRHSSWAQSEYH
ncbi:RNA polymerase sigma factor [Kribbella italica]|uniref:DNA-directed RNA polymerase specialized sigma24 family protein n=1 Tax=Kribbella italica TaxID=1540520 RepID=A0A7W9J5Q4_9ACTN|nr:hypothetical protein [Kribbella italica]MBB5835884.1 DNA-directed RNA polymerase specialized sigma24 family protein [Kribbella italica]